MNVTVFGSGYVGLVTSACLAEIGHNVTCIDPDEVRIARLQRGDVPIFERGLGELVQQHLGDSLRFLTAATRQILSRNDVIIIAVGTPTRADGETDLSAVFQVAATIANHANGIVVMKSTVPVSTCRKLRSRLPYRLEVVSNPEFLREGSAVADFLYPDRIVIGSDDPRALKTMEELYRPLLHGFYQGEVVRSAREPVQPKLVHVGVESAELIKLASNAFLATKISFINALSAVAERTGADIAEVATGMGTDTRIGEQFLEAGLGYGGSCFPKDLIALKKATAAAGADFDLLDEVERINIDQRSRFIEKVRFALGDDLRGRRLAALGLAFKPGTDDVRESPALEVVRALMEQGCHISAYDRVANDAARRQFDRNETRIEFASDFYTAATGADAMLILTAWPEFKQLDLDRLRKSMRSAIVVDGRNLFDPATMARAGFTYISVGREAVLQEVRATGTAG